MLWSYVSTIFKPCQRKGDWLPPKKNPSTLESFCWFLSNLFHLSGVREEEKGEEGGEPSPAEDLPLGALEGWLCSHPSWSPLFLEMLACSRGKWLYWWQES